MASQRLSVNFVNQVDVIGALDLVQAFHGRIA